MDKSLEKITPDVTKLRPNRRNYKGGNNAKPLTTRKRFLAAYEEHFGNVTAACYIAGISRQTYYRWMASSSRVNIKFRQQVERIRPAERLKDMIESAFVKRVQQGSDNLIRLGLERKLNDRGYGVPAEDRRSKGGDIIDKVAMAFKDWMEDHPKESLSEKIRWLERFANGRQVDPRLLAERVGLSKVYGSVAD